MARVSLAFAAGAAAVASAQNLARTVLLTEYVNTTGARCLDGTPQRYWIQSAKGANSTKWVFDLMGGGWCESIESCAARAYAPTCYIGSSNPACFNNTPGNSIPGVGFSEVMDFADVPSCLGARWCGGLFQNDSTTNPLTHDWNKVLVPYCDGGSFTGDNDNVTWTTYNDATVPLYFRGFRNLDAVLSDLIANEGLASATEVIVTGNSAGGLATLHHADHFTARLPWSKVVAIPDSGFFFQDATFPAWTAGLTWVATAMNSTAGLNQNCVAAQIAAGADPATCIFPEVAAPYVTTPLFITNSKYDPALDDISGGENGSNVTNVNRLGARLVELVNATVLNRRGNAAFYTACHEHCGQWAQDQQLGPNGEFNDFNVTILTGSGSGSGSITAVPAVSQWYASVMSGSVPADPDAFVWLQQATYPCNNCCQGGQS